MTEQALNIILIISALLLIDLYVLNGIRGAFQKWHFLRKKVFTFLYWAACLIVIFGLLTGVYVHFAGLGVRAAGLLIFSLLFIGKLTFLPFLIIDDIKRLLAWRKNRFKNQTSDYNALVPPENIPRSEFLLKAGLLAGAIPLAAIKINMAKGLYDYHVRYQTLYLPNLPKAFDGIKLGQISDIHSGSFYNKKAVLGGVEMLLKEKPDFIFFTGDLVNGQANEMRDYQDIFSKVKAPLGVYSSFGNHDYGDYGDWPNAADKIKDHQDLILTHKNMGWDLLRNENRRLKINGEEIGILGIENWSLHSRFPKYGRMELATKNTDDLPVKLLLSHDPSHWRAQVLKDYPQIDVMFSGHTHGMQFGVRTNDFQWSPIKYVYNEWAGHYQQGSQQLYVNVGYGFVGLYGRVGILPEITIFTLKAGHAPSGKLT
ncbi:metallophosphoesterase [Mucilaginibacter ginsenosidivorax]|uniref:Metallophosphoesterase n=1 Tax=Mucilaginibacter ginsenosidivorax TaxID=862126 RepID=A0A5B8VZI6_9SPHI|nr:metallophosphoesterase [Mucilaginibacter ginsenosidivorax]QEC76055.1 metallophosphoesterase [Mucilaginibacter ginsenosidivorax]